jgi:hypothetical protein
MQKQDNLSHGLRWGTVIGIVYCVLLFLRYNQGVKNPIIFTALTLCGYIIVLVLLLICGIKRKKQLGGYIEIKDAFQTMFVAVICFEFFYTAFNFIYLKYIDPDFFQKLKDSTELFMAKNNVSQKDIGDAVSKIDVQASKNLNLGTSFLSLAYAIVVSGIFALIFALIIKKKRPVQLIDQLDS